jgi:Na+-driven multidrug efflux pump
MLSLLVAVLLQGVFRGLQDTKTPLMATLACNLINLCLAPILIFTCGLGIQGAAAAIVIAQVCLGCVKPAKEVSCQLATAVTCWHS